MQHKEVADRVLKAVGGEDNIVAAAHCATRLRMVLKDSKKVDQKALDNDPDLKGTFETGGMFQIIVGHQQEYRRQYRGAQGSGCQ